MRLFKKKVKHFCLNCKFRGSLKEDIGYGKIFHCHHPKTTSIYIDYIEKKEIVDYSPCKFFNHDGFCKRFILKEG